MKSLLLVIAVSSFAFADTRAISVPAGMAELRITAPAGADVTWESRQPIDLSYRSYSLASGDSVIVFCAAAGAKLVIVSDVIDWEARSRDKTTWIVTTEGTSPIPDPPKPDPPGPDPEPDIPEGIPNKYGIGHAIAPHVAGLPANVRQPLIDGFKGFEERLNSGQLTAMVALDSLYRQLDGKTGWAPFKEALQKAITAAGTQYGMGQTDVKNYLREARLTVEAFK